MIEIEKPTIECEFSADDPNYGKFIVEPLERGYGTTLGNSVVCGGVQFVESRPWRRVVHRGPDGNRGVQDV